jgi:hypothetical protein
LALLPFPLLLITVLALFPALTGVANAPAGAAAATAAPIVGAGAGAAAETRGAGSATLAAPVVATAAPTGLDLAAPISLLLAQEKNRSTRL